MSGGSNNKSVLPTILVIFGATGDLTRRKLIPSLYRLYEKKLLPEMFQIVGFSRKDLKDEEFRGRVRKILKSTPGLKSDYVESFAKLFLYRQGFFDKKEGYKKLADLLGFKDKEWRVCSNKLFYLAVPPQYYKKIFKNLADSGLTKPCSPEEGWTRVIVEKPFGKDYKTAEELDTLLGSLFKEEQIYRIDHYLGKETVQNILAFRFSNFFLEPAWHGKFIESIHICLFEPLGVETRGDFYDATGALRDIGQNHLLQLLALFTTEKPSSFDGISIRRERAEVLRSLRIFKGKDFQSHAFRAQYEGYLSEEGVSENSRTETYFKIKAFLDRPRWRGVPIYLEGGKKLPESRAEVTVTFKHKEPCLCPAGAGRPARNVSPARQDVVSGGRGDAGGHYKNVLRYEIQPREGVRISFWVKRPGGEMVLEEKDFAFDYQSAYSKELFVEAYEKLLLDAFAGNQTLFVSTEEVKASWRFIDPIVRYWRKSKEPIFVYKPNSPEIFKKSAEII